MQDDNRTVYRVVINHEEQYSIWPQDRKPPSGWKSVGKVGTRKECTEYIDEVWTDMRPKNLQRHFDEMRRRAEN